MKNRVVVGGKYNWKCQQERLVYLGKKGYWHQFALVGTPEVVWCEVTELDMGMLVETTDEIEEYL